MRHRIWATLVTLMIVIPMFNLSFLNFATAQEVTFPSRPIKFLLGAGVSDVMDLTYRPLCKAAEKILGQPIVVQNTPGAGGNRAMSAILNEKPDGYTLVAVPSGVILAARAEKLDYSIPNDFTPVIQVETIPIAYAVRKDAPYNTWQEFVKYTREHKGQVKVAVWGPVSLPWLALRNIEKRENITFVYIPYSSTGEMMSSILGGHTVLTAGAGAIVYVKSGELKALLLFSERKAKDLPNIPTTQELYGLYGKCFGGGLPGIFAPKGLPRPILMKLHDAFKKAMEDAEYQKAADRLDVIPSYKDPEEFAKLIRAVDEASKEALVGIK
jgi:tripartite-type tricarboxylate transporter receptor subunit TctC